jgi:hypothetical protein
LKGKSQAIIARHEAIWLGLKRKAGRVVFKSQTVLLQKNQKKKGQTNKSLSLIFIEKLFS